MSKHTEDLANGKSPEPESSSKTTITIIPPRPLMNKMGSSGHNIYGSMVRKTSEKTLYGDRSESSNKKKKNTLTENLKVISHSEEVYSSKLKTPSANNSVSLSRSGSFKQPQTNDGSLKKEMLMKQQIPGTLPPSSTPLNQKPPTGILNHVSTPARSRAGTFNTVVDADISVIDDSGLKTPVSAIQFQFEDKIPLRRLPHQHRGSMTPRINMMNPIETSDTSNDISAGSQMARTRTNSQGKKLLITPNSNKQTGSGSSSAATSATVSGNNNSSFLSVSINDIVAQLTGKVENTKPAKNQSAMKIPGGFGDDDDDDEEQQAEKSSTSETSKSAVELPTGRKTSPQLTTINNLINRSANSSSTSLKDDLEIDCKPTKQQIFEYLPKQDDDKFHILLGATGSVATIKIPLIVNKLLKYYTPEKCSIQVVLTQSSLKFIRGLKISPLVKIWTDDDLTFLSNQPYKLGDPILQVELRRWADVFIVAPLSANTLAKISNGISDNLLTNIIRGWPITSTPLYLAPAMNTFMYIHPLTKIHLNTIKELYPTAEILKPVEKVLVCGDIGMGGMREWSDICALVINKLDEMKRDEAENASDEDEDEDEEEDDESLLNRDETDDEDHSEDGEED